MIVIVFVNNVTKRFVKLLKANPFQLSLCCEVIGSEALQTTVRVYAHVTMFKIAFSEWETAKGAPVISRKVFARVLFPFVFNVIDAARLDKFPGVVVGDGAW